MWKDDLVVLVIVARIGHWRAVSRFWDVISCLVLGAFVHSYHHHLRIMILGNIVLIYIWSGEAPGLVD